MAYTIVSWSFTVTTLTATQEFILRLLMIIVSADITLHYMPL